MGPDLALGAVQRLLSLPANDQKHTTVPGHRTAALSQLPLADRKHQTSHPQ